MDRVCQSPDRVSSPIDGGYKPITSSKCRDRLHALSLSIKELAMSIFIFSLGVISGILKCFGRFPDGDISSTFGASKAFVKSAGYSFYTAFFLEKGLQSYEYRKYFKEQYQEFNPESRRAGQWIRTLV